MLFYQDFNEQFEGYTQPRLRFCCIPYRCFIRISMNNLKDIHNVEIDFLAVVTVVLSGFQWTIWRIYTTDGKRIRFTASCFIRISMNNLKDIHNRRGRVASSVRVVLSGFQWTIWRIYTTPLDGTAQPTELFYQDFNEQFEGYTQLELKAKTIGSSCFIRISMNNLKDIHNCGALYWYRDGLFYQDFNEQFEGYTQQTILAWYCTPGCFIRISMNNLKDIHNLPNKHNKQHGLFYQDFNEQFEGYTQLYLRSCLQLCRCFIRISMNNLKDIHNPLFKANNNP